MNDIDELMEKIKFNITDSYKFLKRELFESSGKTFERNWVDLTPKYKDDKRRKYGFVYPIGTATGALLEGVLNKALVVDVEYNEFEDKIDFNLDMDTDRIGLDYADAFNAFKDRNYVKFSDTEKEVIYNVIAETIRNYFGGNS